MIFGKIDYLNLLPFYIFLEKSLSSSAFKKRLEYWRGVPSEINRKFHSRKVDFAFISSVTSANSKCSNLGIIARNEVLSVLVLPKENLKDSASQTSNRLAQILKIDGEVIIGDRALNHFFKNGTGVDLAKEWNKKFNLPFVFAKLCFHKNVKFIKNLERKFKKERVFIPHYRLKRVAKKLDISIENIQLYLSKIDYKCEYKTEKSLKKFIKLSGGL